MSACCITEQSRERAGEGRENKWRTGQHTGVDVGIEEGCWDEFLDAMVFLVSLCIDSYKTL